MSTDNRATESELAMIVVSRTLLDLLIASDVLPLEAIDQVLGVQQEAFTRQRMIKAAGILGALRTLVTDPQAQADRERYKELLAAMPRKH